MFRSRSSALLLLAACGGAQKPAAPSCPTYAKVVLVQDQADLDALASCTSLQVLTIRTGAPLDLAPLAKLERVRNNLTIGPTLALDHISLPALRDVGGRVDVRSNASVGGVFMPQLVRAESVEVAGNGQLTTLSMPRLAQVTIGFGVRSNGSLEIVDLSALARVGKAIGFDDNPLLSTVETTSEILVEGRPWTWNRAGNELQPAVPTSGGGDHE
jgi:hypothetical protein